MIITLIIFALLLVALLYWIGRILLKLNNNFVKAVQYANAVIDEKLKAKKKKEFE